MSKVETTTYLATLHAPLFYSSAEGRTIQTSKTLAATALSYALGYTYFNLEKQYAHIGEKYTEPDYSPLTELPFLITDMTPVDVSADERTFRSTGYLSERHFATMDGELASNIDDKYRDRGSPKGVPHILGMSKEMSTWKTVREFIGLTPGSTFQFTIASRENVQERLRFRMGIKRTGEFSATSCKTADDVSLNKYLLQNVFELEDAALQVVMDSAERFRRGNDPRLQHFEGVPTETFESVAESIL